MTKHETFSPPGQPKARKTGQSMLERAAEAYDFDAFFKGPGVAIPHFDSPHVQAPVVQAPHVQAPPVQAPVVQALDVQAPVVQAPDFKPPHHQGQGVYGDIPPYAPPLVASLPIMVPVAAAMAPPPPVTPVVQPRMAARGAIQPINRDTLIKNGMIVPGGQVSGLAEEYRIVKRTLLRKAFGARNTPALPRGNRILVASANPGEGKTFSAVNLALSMAQEQDHEVLLVDADFAKPSVMAALGLSGGRGLMDALADPTLDVADCLIATDLPNLMVLPAGQQTNQDTEYLASARTAHVIDRLQENAPNRIIIFDSPPVLAASPAVALSSHVGQVLMVVRADVTKESSLRDAISLMAACDEMMLLLNGVKFTPGDRKFGTYYGYGE